MKKDELQKLLDNLTDNIVAACKEAVGNKPCWSDMASDCHTALLEVLFKYCR